MNKNHLSTKKQLNQQKTDLKRKEFDFLEFFKGEGNQLSMHRLLAFISWFPATIVLIYLHNQEALAIYLGVFVGNSAIQKFADKRGRNARTTTR